VSSLATFPPGSCLPSVTAYAVYPPSCMPAAVGSGERWPPSSVSRLDLQLPASFDAFHLSFRSTSPHAPQLPSSARGHCLMRIDKQTCGDARSSHSLSLDARMHAPSLPTTFTTPTRMEYGVLCLASAWSMHARKSVVLEATEHWRRALARRRPRSNVAKKPVQPVPPPHPRPVPEWAVASSSS
jgi:hypothetical protein